MRILLVIAFLIPLALIGQTVSIKGYIVDSDNEAIVNVRVKVGSAASAYTDEEGFFESELSLRSHANRRTKIVVEKKGYQTYEDNSLIITDSKTKVLDKITLFREGESPTTAGAEVVKDNSNLIETNDEMIEENQSVLNTFDNLPIQYRAEIRSLQTQMEQSRITINELKRLVASIEDELSRKNDKDRFLQNLLTKEQTILGQQERIMSSQEAIIKALSLQSAKGNLKIANAKVRRANNDAIDITFRLEDAFGNRPTAGETQVIGIKVAQLTGQSGVKNLQFRPDGSELERMLLEQNVDLSRENTIRFSSPNAFRWKYRRKGYIISFYVGDTLIGVQGFRK